MNWFGMSNNLIRWVYTILKLTGIWWLFSLPYAFLGVTLLIARDVDTVHTIVVSGIVLLPFILIPATVASLAIARKYVKGEEVFPFLKGFWTYYKREYKKSMVLGCLNVAIMVIFYLALRYYSGISYLLAIFFYVLVIITPFFFLLLYSFLVDQELPLKAYISNTFFLLITHPLNTFLMILYIVVVTYVLWVIFSPLLLFILPGLIVLIVTYFFQKSISIEIQKRQPVHKLTVNN